MYHFHFLVLFSYVRVVVAPVEPLATTIVNCWGRSAAILLSAVPPNFLPLLPSQPSQTPALLDWRCDSCDSCDDRSG